MLHRTLIAIAAMLLSAMPMAAAETVDTAAIDTSAVHTPHKRGFMTRFLDYFNDANKEKKNKRFDFSIIGGPHYSTDTKLGLGLVAAGLYRSDPTDSLSAPSNVSLFGDISTVGFYMLGVRGTHKFPHDTHRIDYTLYFYSFPCYIWGLGYDMGDNDDNKSKMKRWQAQAKASWLIRTADNLFVGPTVAFDYVRGHDMQRPELIEGQRRISFNSAAGLTLLYDTRDNLTAPHEGVFLQVQQLFRPKFMGNKRAFSTTDLRMDAYLPMWKGATLAGDLRTQFNFGNPQWSMLARRQLFHARILSGPLSRQAQGGGTDRAATARMATQRHRTMGRSRHSIPQVQPDQDEPYTTQLRLRLSLGVQEECQRAS